MTDVITPLLVRGSGLKRRGGLLGDCLAEFLGTAVLIMFGDGVVAMAVAGLPGSGRAETPTTIFLAAGDWLLITWGWALAVVFGVYVAGGVSGAHLNPAVTLAFAIRRKFPWVKVVPYWISQVVGAFVGAAIVYSGLSRRHPGVRRRVARPAHQRAHFGHVLDLRHVPVAGVRRLQLGAAAGSDRGHRAAVAVYRGRHRPA